MFKYNTKLIISGNFIEKYVYENMIFKGLTSACQVGNLPSELPTSEKKRRIDNLHVTQGKIRRLINANPQLDKFITLTFKENILDLKKANLKFKKFRQRLEYQKSFKLEYVNVVEFQKRGAVHYHMLANSPFIEKDELTNIWGEGFIKINKIGHVNNIGAYVCKYLTKEAMKLSGKKKFMYSPNLNRPQEIFNPDLIALIENSDKFQSAELQFQNSYESPACGEVIYKQFKTL